MRHCVLLSASSLSLFVRSWIAVVSPVLCVLGSRSKKVHGLGNGLMDRPSSRRVLDCPTVRHADKESKPKQKLRGGRDFTAQMDERIRTCCHRV